MDIFLSSFSLMALKTNFLKESIGRFFVFIHSGVNNIFNNTNISYGLTIILVTIIIRLVLFPLNYKQIKSQVKMNEIQPEMKKLQEKYKSDPQKQQQEIMKLYKENGVNPLGGCLPLLLQWPILIAMYYVFNNLGTFSELQNIQSASFLGLKLMEKASLSIKNWNTWILPLLSGALTYFSTAMAAPSGDSAQAKQTRTMNIAMTGMITWMSFNFNTALVLYWVTNSLFQLAQTYVTKKRNIAKKDEVIK